MQPLCDVCIVLSAQHWSKMTTTGASPAVREGHTACCIGGPLVGSQLLVIGGYSHFKTLKDAWVLDLGSQTWSEVLFPWDFLPAVHETI